MSFKITVSFFIVDAVSFSSVEGNLDTFRDKTLLYSVDLYHTYVQDVGLSERQTGLYEPPAGADSIIQLYPISRKMYYTILTEQAYAVIVVLLLCSVTVTLYLTRSSTGNIDNYYCALLQ